MQELKSQLRAAITEPRTLRAQTERHIHEYVDEGEEDWQHFFDTAAQRLEEYEIEMLFGPVFTPSFSEQARFSAILAGSVPAADELNSLLNALASESLCTRIHLPDGRTLVLPLHRVMLERYVKLLRFECAPSVAVVETLSRALPPELRDYALALARHRAFGTPTRQRWLADYLAHVAATRRLVVEDLVALADFMASRRELDANVLRREISETVRSARTALRTAQQGHRYLSSDVAEHHHFRGQGTVDKHRVQQKLRDLELLEQLEVDLQQYLDTRLSAETDASTSVDQ